MSVFEGREIIDISPVLREETAVFPGDTSFQHKESMSFKLGDHLSLSSIETTVHIGAHADAPIHYHPDGQDILKRDLRIYLGSVEVVEVTTRPGHRVAKNDFNLTSKQIERVIFKTNSFPNPDEWRSNFCSLSPEVINELNSRGVRLVGIDTPSIDPHDSKELESHNAIFVHDMAVLEGLVLSHVDPGLYDLIALPLSIEGADASPVRAILLK